MQTIKILVIDDADVILNALKNFLEEYKFEVFTSKDGLEGLLKASEVKPDLIFLDIMMPNLDGLNMLQIKKGITEIKDIPVIVISANTNKENVMKAIKAGASKVISKPLRKDAVMKFMTEVLGQDYFYDAPLSDIDEDELRKQIQKAFSETFGSKIQELFEAIKNHDDKKLRAVLHNIKGSAGTLNIEGIEDMIFEIEGKEIKDPIDWVFVERKCKKLVKTIYDYKKKEEDKRKKD